LKAVLDPFRSGFFSATAVLIKKNYCADRRILTFGRYRKETVQIKAIHFKHKPRKKFF
jgi:hypothetical protein